MKFEKLCALLFLFSFFISCSPEAQKTELSWNIENGYQWAELQLPSQKKTGFKQLSSGETGITFQNYLAEESYINNRVLLNGSGVAAGDVNGDGWPDVYFTQLDGPNKLYLNEGNFRFRDITDSAGVSLSDYKSAGTVLSDVDGDGDLDLLVATYHNGTILMMNDGEGNFSRSKQSGLDSTAVGGTTMSLADIDSDGDLDLYVTHYKNERVRDLYSPRERSGSNVAVRKGDRYEITPEFQKFYTNIQTVQGPALREIGTRDELYLNKGGIGNNWKGFEKVTNLEDHFLDENGNPAGVGQGWGLTARFEDMNGDGLPDLYVCNDYWTLDQFWINQGNGIFKKINPLKFRHMSISAMGVAVGDINNDGHSDFFVSDMLSPDHNSRFRQIKNMDPFPIEVGAIKNQPQYTQNTLYLNRGDNSFTEIANYSGVEASGWSWATTFMDIDLDGLQDLLVNTGYEYDAQDLDTNAELGRRSSMNPDDLEQYLKGKLLYPPLDLPNRIYKNEGDLKFTEVGESWGFTEEDVSHGLAIADFNQDGALDIVSNRMNQEAGVYKNTSGARRIAVRLVGSSPNTQAIGARVTLQGEHQQNKQIVSGGDYMSGSSPQLMFAANNSNPARVLNIRWPDGTKSRIDSVKPDRIYKIYQDSIATRPDTASQPTPPRPVFKEVSENIDFTDPENDYKDYQRQRFIPLMLSQLGPGVAWLDYNGDDRTDIVQTSGKDGQLEVFRNEGQGQFSKDKIPGLESISEGDQTSVVGWQTDEGINIVVGRSDYEQSSPGGPSAYHYTIQQGRVVKTQQLWGQNSSTGPLAAADYNRDGKVDLFLGGRVIPGNYPKSASSFLYKNVNGDLNPDKINSKLLQDIGMVTGAVFTDYNNDGWQDLLISTSWGSLKLFKNENGQFRDVTKQMGLAKYQGWWNGVATGDFNGDGQQDIVATNWGTNSQYEIVEDHPMRMYYGNLDGDRSPDIIQANYNADMEAYVPMRQLRFYSGFWPMRANVRSYKEYSESSLREILGSSMLEMMSYKEINTLESMVFINKGGQEFKPQPLPRDAQLTAGFDASVGDYNNDGNEDVFLSQNFFDLPPGDMRLDGGRGLWLKGDGTGNFTAVKGQHSGVKVYGEQRGSALGDYNADGRVDLVVTQNGNRTKLYENQIEKRGFRIRLVGPLYNRDAIGASLQFIYEDGNSGPERTIQAGSGYWSQNSTVQVMGYKDDTKPVAVKIRWPKGSTQKVSLQPDKWNYTITYEE